MSRFLYIKPSIRCVIDKSIFSLCRLLICVNGCVLCQADFQFHEVQFIYCLSQCQCHWCSVQKKKICQCIQGYCPHFLLLDSMCWVWFWGLWSIWIWVYCTVISMVRLDFSTCNSPVWQISFIEDVVFFSGMHFYLLYQISAVHKFGIISGMSIGFH